MLYVTENRVVVILFCALFILCTISIIEAKSNEEIYAERLAQLKPDDVNGHYQLGLWCLQNKLSEEAKSQFEKVLELEPNHIGAREKLGYVKYKDKWITPEELESKGLALYKGKWIPYDEAMKAQGYVKFEDQWVTTKEYNFLKELSKKLAPSKGVLDKPGADDENLPWEKAREKETDHFIVKTNLSVDALNDICFILEYAYFSYQDLFGGFEQPKAKGKKLRVLVSKNQDEFKKIYHDLLGTNPPPEENGTYIPASAPHNKLRQERLLSFYKPSVRPSLTSRLLHECTHYAMSLVRQYPNPPIWFAEGWATYCEASRLEGKRLVTKCINQWKLPIIKNVLNKQTYIKLNDFINRTGSEYDFGLCYPQGWSLIYFLLNGQNGKYKTGFQSYMEAWKKGKIVTDTDYAPQDKTAHLKLFEKCIGVPIDQLEKEWKEYILSLK